MNQSKLPSIKKIRTYFYLTLLLVNIVALFYLFSFAKKNIYYSINFNESNFPQNLRQTGDIDIDIFDEVVNTIDEKKNSKTLRIDNFFNN